MRLPDGHAYLLRTAMNVSNTYGYDLELIRSFKTRAALVTEKRLMCTRTFVCAKALHPDTPLECALSNQWQYALFIAFVPLPNQKRSNSGRNSQAIFQPPTPSVPQKGILSFIS